MASRERRARDLRRKKGTRPRLLRVLIVCEGEKTERQYFKAVYDKNPSPAATPKMMKPNGTSPLQVVLRAEKEFRSSKEGYDWVFAVFDRDNHSTYIDALNKAEKLGEEYKNTNGEPRFMAIPSVPCFELWFLLHFEDIHAFSERHDIIEKLYKYIPDYEKGSTDIYARTELLLEQAKKRAGKLQQKFDPRAKEEEPITLVHKVVDILQSIKNNLLEQHANTSGASHAPASPAKNIGPPRQAG